MGHAYVQRFLQRAIAAARAALEAPTPERVRAARAEAASLRQVERLQLTLAEASDVVQQAAELRGMLEAAERRLRQLHAPPTALPAGATGV